MRMLSFSCAFVKKVWDDVTVSACATDQGRGKELERYVVHRFSSLPYLG